VRISVVIPTYRRPDDLEIALDSVVRQTFDPRAFEIVVVDNAATPACAARVEAWRRTAECQVRYVAEPRVGLHNARHAGAYRASGEIVAYVDDDVRATPGWLAGLCEGFTAPEVAVVGGIVEPLWAAAPPPWIAQMPPGYLSLLDLGPHGRDLSWPEGVYGCNLAVRRRVLFEVGGFNPDGFADPSMQWYRGDGETGLLRKIYAAGYRVRYAPAARVYHRIPVERLTEQYFAKRARCSGVSDAFAAYRAWRLGTPRPPTESTPGARSDAVRRVSSLGRVISALRRAPAPVPHWRFRVAYYAGVSGFLARLALSRELRRHVRRPSYLDDPPRNA
jgi:glucosyl-dolichyl phosphate glucuronosyltransferase